MQQERFLSRWSRRKLRARRDDAQTPTPAAAPPSPTVSEPAAADAVALPPLDTLDEGSDYSGYLAPEIADELQRMALRKLFGSARFNIRDGLDDYADDYRFFETLGDTVTADMRHRMERELGERLGADSAAQGHPPAPAGGTEAVAPTEEQAAQGEALPEPAPPGTDSG